MSILESLINENKRLAKANKLLSKQISIAKQGLEALLYNGDIGSISKKTLTEIKSLEEPSEDLPQESNKEQDEDI